MRYPDFSVMDDDNLADLLFVMEDRLPLEAATEIAGRENLLPILGQLAMDKQNWLVELPEWWAVIHACYLLGHNASQFAALPLTTALRWADAFDCDWVTEVLPSIHGRVGPPMIPGLTAVVRDFSAGWSARDLAMKGLAAVAQSWPESCSHCFRIIGERFMDEDDDRVVRQLAGQILLDFRRQEYRLALLQFAREEWSARDLDSWYPIGFEPDEVEMAFRNPEPEVWHYCEDWMRFYDPAEIQRRQKRWSRERLGQHRAWRESRGAPTGGGRVLPFGSRKQPTGGNPSGNGGDPDKPSH